MIDFKYAKVIKYNDLDKIHHVVKSFKPAPFLINDFFSNKKLFEIIRKEIN